MNQNTIKKRKNSLDFFDENCNSLDMHGDGILLNAEMIDIILSTNNYPFFIDKNLDYLANRADSGVLSADGYGSHLEDRDDEDVWYGRDH
jgi:hypothetical protein